MMLARGQNPQREEHSLLDEPNLVECTNGIDSLGVKSTRAKQTIGSIAVVAPPFGPPHRDEGELPQSTCSDITVDVRREEPSARVLLCLTPHHDQIQHSMNSRQYRAIAITSLVAAKIFAAAVVIGRAHPNISVLFIAWNAVMALMFGGVSTGSWMLATGET
jgi:hypothetical protein